METKRGAEKMKDRSLGVFLMLIFGVSGIAVLLLAWLWPTLASDRITGIIAGSAGLGVALTQVKSLRRSPIKVANTIKTARQKLATIPVICRSRAMDER